LTSCCLPVPGAMARSETTTKGKASEQKSRNKMCAEYRDDISAGVLVRESVIARKQADGHSQVVARTERLLQPEEVEDYASIKYCHDVSQDDFQGLGLAPLAKDAYGNAVKLDGHVDDETEEDFGWWQWEEALPLARFEAAPKDPLPLAAAADMLSVLGYRAVAMNSEWSSKAIDKLHYCQKLLCEEARTESSELMLIPLDSGKLTSLGSSKHPNCSPCIFWTNGVCSKMLLCDRCHFVHPRQPRNRVRPNKRARELHRQMAVSDGGEHC